MELSCVCPYDDLDAPWYYYAPDNFSTFKLFRSKRCTSCNCLISYGSPVLVFERFRFAHTDIEEKIYGHGNEMPLASWFMCESCGEIFLNLTAIGYCFQLKRRMDMPNSLKQYQEISGFKKRMEQRIGARNH